MQTIARVLTSRMRDYDISEMVGVRVKLINAGSERKVFLRRWGERKIL